MWEIELVEYEGLLMEPGFSEKRSVQCYRHSIGKIMSVKASLDGAFALELSGDLTFTSNTMSQIISPSINSFRTIKYAYQAVFVKSTS
jgi:hypothetical protein